MRGRLLDLKSAAEHALAGATVSAQLSGFRMSTDSVRVAPAAITASASSISGLSSPRLPRIGIVAAQ